jgi:hypothetical protein
MALSFYVLTDIATDETKEVERIMQRAYSGLGIGEEIDPNALSNRVLPSMVFDTEYGKRILTGEAINFVTVTRNDENKVPFILFRDEYRLINQLAKVSPQVSLGYRSKASDKDINDFRQRLLKTIQSNTQVSKQVRNYLTARLVTMDKQTMALQIRSYGNNFAITPSFIEGLLPTPEINLAPSKMAIPFCTYKVALCPVSASRVKLQTINHFMITFADKKYQMNNADKLQYVSEQTTAYKKQEAKKQDYWLLVLSIITIGLGILFIILFWRAKVKAKQCYQE